MTKARVQQSRRSGQPCFECCALVIPGVGDREGVDRALPMKPCNPVHDTFVVAVPALVPAVRFVADPILVVILATDEALVDTPHHVPAVAALAAPPHVVIAAAGHAYVGNLPILRRDDGYHSLQRVGAVTLRVAP